ncbi:MAG: hypothetical protein JWO82_2688 [Akkermansiaceae bacterium]|nr:hypothetical protein [Akkermansiaceae bacterium]
MSSAPKASLPVRIYLFFSSVGLATALLVVLMIETWLATLEQVDHGLHQTLLKYFNYKAWYVLPDAAALSDSLAGKYLPPLPGGYWVCALLVLNLILGGVIRIKKTGLKNIGVLLAHFGIIFMVISGGITQIGEKRGIMMLKEGEQADFAQDFINTTIEISAIKDGKVEGFVHLIDDSNYTDLEGQKTRTVHLPSLPFDIELQAFTRNGVPVSATSAAPERNEPVVDGWFFAARKPGTESELDTPGIYARIIPKDDSVKGQVAILSVASYQPLTVRSKDAAYAVRLNKRIWPIPFQVRLDDARTKYYPNTNKPASYESDITRIEDGREMKKLIEMNEPMRYAGYTFFQRTMSGADPSSKEVAMSGFEVVRNPSDKWPKYSIIVAGFGLFLHFVLKLAGFVFGRRSSPKNPSL